MSWLASDLERFPSGITDLGNKDTQDCIQQDFVFGKLKMTPAQSTST